MNTFDLLNSTYEKMNQKRNEIVKHLKSQGYQYKCGYYSHHAVKVNNEWITEEYPIPVITVEGIGDIGIDLKHIFFEMIITRSKALIFDFSKLEAYKFEIYGVDNYLEDFYNESMSLQLVHKKIEESKEESIGISLFFSSDETSTVICKAITEVIA